MCRKAEQWEKFPFVKIQLPQVDASLVRIQKASQSVFAVCQPKGIKAAVRSRPYAL